MNILPMAKLMKIAQKQLFRFLEKNFSLKTEISNSLYLK